MKIVYARKGKRYLVQYYSDAYKTCDEDDKWRDSRAFDTEKEAIAHADALAGRINHVRVVDRGE